IRTGDIEEVGDDTHLTFFEMLGNWSLGDYFKPEAIDWSYEFLTDKKWLGLPVEKLAISCFAGDKDAPQDNESAELWQKLGIPQERVTFLGKEDNWWGPAGQTGPCGPDTEMFYWIGSEPAPVVFDPADKRWFEIWNDVFMQYDKQLTESGKNKMVDKDWDGSFSTEDFIFKQLKQRNVDTGMGLERTLVALNGLRSVYETDLFAPIMDKVKNILPTIDVKSQRIISDHIKASVFLLSDGVEPSNKDRGYILRRLIRRAVARANMKDIDFDSQKLKLIAQIVLENYKDIYQEFKQEDKRSDILNKLSLETRKFRATIEKGFKEFEKGTDPFILFTSYGFPIELTQEIAAEKGVEIDLGKFNKDMKKHQELSRTASAGQFKGGLADNSEIITRLHTVTHLMNAALRQVLGEHVWQKGSNITAERTRFDFTHPEKMTEEQKSKVEELVNGWIGRDLTVKKEVMPVVEAKKLNGIGVFGEKYADTVSVYTVIDSKTGEVVSREFCGGPHVEHTGVIGQFKILKEEAVAAGIRHHCGYRLSRQSGF
ncbi:MAG: alanyl-tRNA synthetase, partial [Parcubacteria group bacterium GW2011_GWA2_42_80]